MLTTGPKLLITFNGTAIFGVTNMGTAGSFNASGTSGNPLIARGGKSAFNISNVATTPFATLDVMGSSTSAYSLYSNTLNHQTFLARTSATSTSEYSRAVVGIALNSTWLNSGVWGIAQAQSSPTYNTGVYGSAYGSATYGYGVYGVATGSLVNSGIYGSMTTGSGTNYAGYFYGTLYATTGTFGTKPFMIDHPLDPENMILRHSSIESPDMMNMYNGTVTTDANGYATVTLPSYFQALNENFKYQLTIIDNSEDFIQAKITEEVKNN